MTTSNLPPLNPREIIAPISWIEAEVRGTVKRQWGLQNLPDKALPTMEECVTAMLYEQYYLATQGKLVEAHALDRSVQILARPGVCDNSEKFLHRLLDDFLAARAGLADGKSWHGCLPGPARNLSLKVERKDVRSVIAQRYFPFEAQVA